MAEALPAPEWAAVIDRVKGAIVAIRVTCVRPFEDSPAGVWQGTGFVVSLANPKEALILTNRHIISTGPIRAFATFDEHEELPVWPVYRDPVHDFGILQFDATALRFTPATQIPLSSEGLRVGAEVLVIGNDNAEKIQILPATIARVDRNSPEYDDTNYQDENTFYAGAGSNTSGGSSGSPVIDRSGACIALNAGGANEAASAYYLPLDSVVYVLGWLQSHPSEAPLPPRGTILTKFLFQPFDMLRRLGFTQEQEQQALAVGSKASADGAGTDPGASAGRAKGMLVVESFLPGTEAEEKLQPGDVLLEVAGEPCLDFASLEAKLDACVEAMIPLRISRAGKPMAVELKSFDLHALIPFDFVECAGGVFHQLSYHTCKRFHITVADRGIFVAQSGFGFGLELPYHAVVVAVTGTPVASLSDFEAALAGVKDGETFEVSWYNPTTNERRPKRSSVRMESTLWPLCAWGFSPGRPNAWRRRAVRAGAAKKEAGEAAAAKEVAKEPAAGPDEQLGYPPSRDATIARVQPMLCTVTSRVAHEFATDFIQSDDERNSTLIRRFGVGLVLDVERGLVLTDRYAVPQPLAHVELTFAQIVTTDAVCLFIHPQHNFVLLRYDTSALRELPVRAVDLRKATGEQDAVEELSIGEVLNFVSLHGDHRLSAKQVTVGSIYLKAWAFAEPPAYRERNLEICNLNDTLQGLGGLLVEPGASGSTRAWFAQFPAGKKHYVAGVPVPVLLGLLRPLGLLGGLGPEAPLPLHEAQVPALDCEFEELSLAKARRYHGMSLESTRELAASCSDGRRQVLMVSRVTTGGACDGLLSEGDVVLRVCGRPVTRPQEVEALLEQQRPGTGAGVGTPGIWQVLRSRQQVDVPVQPSWRCSDGTSRLLVFNGLALRPTLRAVAERGGPVPPHARPGEGLYFWYIFPGSPADTFGLMAPGWLVSVDDEATPNIGSLLEAVSSGKFRGREWLRCCTMDSEGRPTVRALQPDSVFWPTIELRGCIDGSGAGKGTVQWTRIEHADT
mmetsp:Transcript_11262/g.26579  ORF Transcript_11262/g.26579 Transcript_11262/m.26579 type:complete len:1017 (+) Transcript_11262:1-3051(+)